MINLNDERKSAYNNLKLKIGSTPLVKYIGKVPNNNSIWIKRECDNPFGSHYDRVYLALYKYWEKNVGLKPGMNVLESTSGSAGVSFAGIGRELGYNCFVMIPKGEQLQKRRKAIQEQGATLILTPEDEYINGFPSRILQYKDEFNAKFLNHSMGRKGTCNEVTLSSLEGIAKEVLAKQPIDIFVGGIGNGSSIVGPGRVFKRDNPQVQIIGYKPVKSGKNELPGLINQDDLDPSIIIPFPHIVEANKLMDEIKLIYDWDEGVENHEDLGRTGRAGISVALDIAKKVNSKNILVLGYDKMERY